MSDLKYYSYEGMGQKHHDYYNYSEAVRVGDRIEISGQGGWDPKTGDVLKDLRPQIEQAFKNVEIVLKDAGGKGWEQVYSIRSYHVPMSRESLIIMGEQVKKYMPTWRPIWTAVGVSALSEDNLMMEMDVVALDPEGAKAAAQK